MFFFWIKQEWKHLAVVNIGGGNGITEDKAMGNIDADAVLIAVVVDAILFDPACIQVFLLQSIWVFIPPVRHPPSLDFLVLFKGIALPGNWDKSCVDNLTATGLKTR